MSFFTSLSGLKAAQADISTTSNNIANINTLGFHGSRAEFSDIYTVSPTSNLRTSMGSGVQISRVARSFAQGSMTSTQNALDLAIQGPGFFRMQSEKEGGDTVFTRAGAFGMDTEGHVVNARGMYLSAYDTAQDGTPLTMTEPKPLKIPPTRGLPQATSALRLDVSLPMGAGVQGTQAAVPSAGFDPTDSATYAFATPLNVLDASGQAVDAMGYFTLNDLPDLADPATRYNFHLVVDGVDIAPDAGSVTELTFDAEGFLTAGGQPAFTFEGQALAIDMSAASMAQGTGLSVLSMKGDGRVPAKIASVQVDNSGVVWASYGDVDAVAVGIVSIARFANPTGLRSLGDGGYAATNESGLPDTGVPGSDGLGSIRSAALEQANVDLTEELVNLIVAQRNYQASAKALETSQALSQTIMNMRG